MFVAESAPQIVRIARTGPARQPSNALLPSQLTCSSSKPTTEIEESGLCWNARPFQREIRSGPYLPVVPGRVRASERTIHRPDACNLYVGVVTVMPSRGKRSVELRCVPSASQTVPG